MARGDGFGDNVAAIQYAKNKGVIGGGSFTGNQPAPRYVTNAYYLPSGYVAGETAMTTTATRCYYFPFAVQHQHTFQSAHVYNSGVGDNGEKIRIMVFRDQDGGPGALEKDFGEITLTAASSLRSLASTWTASPGMYWIAVWCDSASGIFGMLTYIAKTDVGSGGHGVMTMDQAIGNFGLSSSIASTRAMTQCHYVDTAYGTAPSTAVAPTASVTITPFSASTVVPAVFLKG